VAKHTTNFVLSFTGLIDLSAVYWILDEARSSIGIRSKSMWGLATVDGTFTKVGGEGEIALDGTAHGTLTIDAASIKTKSDRQMIVSAVCGWLAWLAIGRGCELG
jgi:polyisoprenoid-binding protein YceI